MLLFQKYLLHEGIQSTVSEKFNSSRDFQKYLLFNKFYLFIYVIKLNKSKVEKNIYVEVILYFLVKFKNNFILENVFLYGL